MIVMVRDTLDRKYMLPGSVMPEPYTEDRDGYLYLVSDNPEAGVKRRSILCDAIVSVEVIA